MKRYTLPIALLAMGASMTMAQNNDKSLSLSEMMAVVEKQFDVKIKYNVDTVGKRIPLAMSRIRPYSVEATLDNICKYFDFNWWKQTGNAYKIKPYEAPRRHDEEGRLMLEWLSKKYNNKAEWEARREVLRRELRQRLEIDEYLDSCYADVNGDVTKKKAILSKVRKYDGYTVQNICIETLTGEHVFGSIYTPDMPMKKASRKGSKGAAEQSNNGYGLIICPNGHFGDGRYRKDQQQRMATLARMGAICVDYDLYAWGESKDEYPTHQTERAHVVQAMNGLVLLNWMLSNRAKDIDTQRIGVNGGSGGGTLTVHLAALDDRFTAAAPTVNLASHFDGGCPCESGKPIHLSAGGTCNPELLATFAPKPVLVVSDGGDWTASVPTIEFPYLQRMWSFYGAENLLTNVHLPKERHDFGPNKRNAVYDFFIKVFNLDASKLDESKVTIEPHENMMTKLNRTNK